MPWGTFKLAELNLDLENVRIGSRAEPQPDQRAAIRALIDDQKQKLVNLAIDLLDYGPSPGEPIWVTTDLTDPKHQVVLEGNRRVCALKLMDNPRLADGTEVATQFADLAKEFAKKPIRTLDAALFPKREDAQHFIDLRHMRGTAGVGLEKWRSLAKERAQPGWSGRVRRSLFTLDYLDDDTDEFGDVGAIIEAKSTTVDRVLNSPAMKEVLGVNIDPKTRSVTFENGDEIAGRRLLRDVITEMARPDSQFSEIRDKGDRETFIRRFADRAVKAPGGPPPPSGAAKIVPFPKAASRPRLTERARATLAPTSADRAIARVKGTRLNKLYRECRKLPIANNENAAALLMRVFLELSSEVLLVEKAVTLPAKHAVKKTDWSEVGISLEDKINAVMPLIDTTPRTKQLLKQARVALANKHHNGSIDTLHAYFHNPDITLSVPAIRDAWDTWENYLRLLHGLR